jgi:hypothetical protein
MNDRAQQNTCNGKETLTVTRKGQAAALYHLHMLLQVILHAHGLAHLLSWIGQNYEAYRSAIKTSTEHTYLEWQVSLPLPMLKKRN